MPSLGYTRAPSSIHRLLRWIVVAAIPALVFVTAPVTTAASAQNLDDRIDRARERQAEVQVRLDEAAARLADFEARAGELSNRRDEIAARLETLTGEIRAAERRVADRVRSLYMRNDFDPMLALFGSDDPGEGLERAAVVRSLVRDDRAASETADAKRETAAALQERLAAYEQELGQTLASHREFASRLREDLREAESYEGDLVAEKRRRAEEARRRAAAAARAARESASAGVVTAAGAATSIPSSGGYACPIGTPRSYTDTWGAPRSGGRSHQGVDMLAPYGTPIYAVTSGVVDLRGYGGSAGYWIIFHGSDGDQYWYMHLQGYAVGDGAHVSAGQVIGYNGDTGNARGTPHLHFERHPGGGGAVNPYPFVRSLCG